MADIFVSYTRADQDMVRRIVALLEAQGWSVWWDTRISGGERWDAVIEREITAARCVVVVWTPQSIDREWVLVEAHHGHGRGILVPILIGVDKPPFAFSLVQALNLSAWDGVTETAAAAVQFLMDVRQKLDGISSHTPQPDPARFRPEGRVKVDAKIIHDAPDGWFKPGAGKAEWFKDIEFGPEMVVVPAGSFTMGSNDYDSERAPHEVTIKAPLAVGRFAVTFREWDAAILPAQHMPLEVVAVPWGHPWEDDRGWGRGRRPVINVSWEAAKAYAGWLWQKTGKEYRLLSEAEWEYCCRAGTTTKYAFGDTITQQQAQFAAAQTVEVGKFPPNAWGLHDMHGNVWEWCEDNWHDDHKGAPQDGSARSGGETSQRVLRGGAWDDATPDHLRSAFRFGLDQSFHHSMVGFRLIRTL